MATETFMAIIWAQFFGAVWGILLVTDSLLSVPFGLVALLGAFAIAHLGHTRAARRAAQDREG